MKDVKIFFTLKYVKIAKSFTEREEEKKEQTNKPPQKAGVTGG